MLNGSAGAGQVPKPFSSADGRCWVRAVTVVIPETAGVGCCCSCAWATGRAVTVTQGGRVGGYAVTVDLKTNDLTFIQGRPLS